MVELRGMTAQMRLAGEGDRWARGPNDELVDVLEPGDFDYWHGGPHRDSRDGLRCFGCNESVHFVYYKWTNKASIAHNSGLSCHETRSDSANTTVQHEVLKLWCRDRLRDLGADVSVDEYQIGARRTDVFAQFGERKFAVEVQWSRMSREDVLRHTAVLASHGCQVVWLTWHCNWLAEVPAAAITTFEPGTRLNFELSQGLLYRKHNQMRIREKQVELDQFFVRWVVVGDIAWGYRETNRGGWAEVTDWEAETRKNVTTIANHEATIEAQLAQIATLGQTTTQLRSHAQTLQHRAEQLGNELRTAQQELRTQADTAADLSKQLSSGSEQWKARAATHRHATSVLDGHLRRLQSWVDTASRQRDRLRPRPPLPPPPRAGELLRQQRARLDLTPAEPQTGSGAAWWETKRWAQDKTRSAGGTRWQRWRHPLGATQAAAAVRKERKQAGRSKRPRALRIAVVLTAAIASLVLLAVTFPAVLPFLAVVPCAVLLACVFRAVCRSVTVVDRRGGRVTLTRATGCVEVTNWYYLPRVKAKSSVAQRHQAGAAQQSARDIVLDLLDWAEDNGVFLVAGAATAWHGELYRRASFTTPQSAGHKASFMSRAFSRATGKPQPLVRVPGYGKADRKSLISHLTRTP
jgi:hypothetical protein